MIDVDHLDGVVGFVNFVHDAVGAHPGGMESGKVTEQWFADSVRVLDQWTQQEIEYRNGDLGGKTVDRTVRRSGNEKTPGRLDHVVPV